MGNVPVDALSRTGRLYEVGDMDISTGGAVANTGLALHRLGIHVGMMSLVGDDALGRIIVEILSHRDPELTQNINVLPGIPSSYSVVLSPAHADRIFLHCPGTNSHFGPEHIDYDVAERAKIVHLGYPPILPRMMRNDGAELVQIFAQLKSRGVVTSLDMVVPDAGGQSGQVNWQVILRNVLPYVDIFVPSFEEIAFVLRRIDFDRGSAHLQSLLTRKYLEGLTSELLALGVTVAGIKCGEDGIWLHAGSQEKLDRLRARLPLPEGWDAQTAWHPAFDVQVVGTTGAGDSAYAAILASMLRGMSLQDTARWACAVGACNVEAPDAESGIRTWEATSQRLADGWQTRSSRLARPG